MGLLATSLVSFRISYMRSEPTNNLSFQSNKGERVMNSVII
jgi:hypothetical protein